MNIEDINNLGKYKKGGFRKLPETPQDNCNAPGHNPPANIYLEGGTYEYTFPACGKVQIIKVPKITF